jgi:hypothetical protein
MYFVMQGKPNGLDGQGNEARWRRDFQYTCPGAHPASCIVGTGSFPGVKRPGRGVDHPPPPSARIPSGTSWPVLG